MSRSGEKYFLTYAFFELYSRRKCCFRLKNLCIFFLFPHSVSLWSPRDNKIFRSNGNNLRFFFKQTKTKKLFSASDQEKAYMWDGEIQLLLYKSSERKKGRKRTYLNKILWNTRILKTIVLGLLSTAGNTKQRKQKFLILNWYDFLWTRILLSCIIYS